MKHVTYSDKSLLVDDDAALALIEYARVVAMHGASDTVSLHALGDDGNEVEAVFLLTPATILMVESANTSILAPDNSEVTDELRERTRRLSQPNRGEPDEAWDASASGLDDF